MQKWLIGVDEVGRGPLAGPVAVGVSLVPADFDWETLPGVTDSKQLTARKREEIYRAARPLQAAARLQFAVSMVSARVIDRIGIVPAIDLAMQRSLTKLTNTPIDWSIGASRVLLDGGLRAPGEFTDQETIVKGDAKEPAIGLASIVAKVARDRYMVQKGAQPLFAPYDFATHKGYGTKKHRAAIAKHGLSAEHRASYCKNIK